MENAQMIRNKQIKVVDVRKHEKTHTRENWPESFRAKANDTSVKKAAAQTPIIL